MGLCPKPHNFFGKKLSKSQYMSKNIEHIFIEFVYLFKLKHYTFSTSTYRIAILMISRFLDLPIQ